MKTATPLLISLVEAGFQLSLTQEDVVSLIREGELVALNIRGQILLEYRSLLTFTGRAKQNRIRSFAELQHTDVHV
jgi:hypothetical protein